MDITTIPCGKDTRKRLKSFKKDQDLANYDEALNVLLDAVEA